jgi:hypothetical protein
MKARPGLREVPLLITDLGRPDDPLRVALGIGETTKTEAGGASM